MNEKKYFVKNRSTATLIIHILLVLMFLFAVVFFLWSIMRYNEIIREKEEQERYIKELTENIDELEYLVEAPLDDAYKIRIARERLGMCFPDEIIFHTGLE